MKRLILVLMMVPAGFLWAQAVVRGDLVELGQQIRNSMPESGSNGFVVPVDSQMVAFQNVIAMIGQDNYASVAAMLSPYGYEWISFIDTVVAESLIVVRELNPIQRGWGTYIRNPRSTNDLAMEIPHPIFDTNTWKLGIRAYLRMRARWCQMAGTHRYANTDSSSDVAHRTRTVFHAVHKTISAFRAIQVHGFNKAANPNYASYADVIISNGTTNPPAELTTLESNYESREMTATVFSIATYNESWRLGATSNVQGQWSNANGKKFVHIEHDYPIRTTDSKLLQAVEAMNAVFGAPTDVAEDAHVPRTAGLGQNYPNPFNPGTVISFQSSVVSRVELRVFDVLGREVAVLVNAELMPGRHEVRWDASEMPSGIYFYTMTSGEVRLTRRMILLK